MTASSSHRPMMTGTTAENVTPSPSSLSHALAGLELLGESSVRGASPLAITIPSAVPGTTEAVRTIAEELPPRPTTKGDGKSPRMMDISPRASHVVILQASCSPRAPSSPSLSAALTSTTPVSIPSLHKTRVGSSKSLASPSPFSQYAEYDPSQISSTNKGQLSRSASHHPGEALGRKGRRKSFSSGPDGDGAKENVASDDDEDQDFIQFLESKTSLPLTPFKNQVGGHAPFLRFSDKALCKPLDSRERDFYEFVETFALSLKPFVATYLGVVNVSFPEQTSEDPGEWWMHGTPLVHLEQNRHILLGEGDEGDICGGEAGVSSELSSRLSLNRKLQKQIFKEAWSPKSLRARYDHVNQAAVALKRNSLSVAKAMGADTADQDSIRNSTSSRKSIEKESLVLHPSGAPQSSSRHSIDKAPVRESCDTLSPIFQMSDDEEEGDLSLPKASSQRRKGSKGSTSTGGGVPGGDSSSNNTSSKELPLTDASASNFNPWSLHLYNNQGSKLVKSSKESLQNNTHQFLLLQDLTSGLKKPCILDLKMGTRQHGVMASPEKKASQERKCERSTSKKLGARICGMQVYKPASQAFFYLDKYAGRNIHHASFKQSLLSFLDNGTHYLIGFIPSLIKKLQALFDVIKTLPSCRFYASSLLVLYDGFSFETSTDMDIRIIDFANCVTNADVLHESSLQGLLPHVPCPPTTLGPDQGYLLGLNTLMRNFEELYQELGGALHGGHVPKEKIPKSARATAEVGLADMGDRSGGPLSALAQASTPGPLSSAPNAPVTLSPSLVDQPSISRPIFTADPPKSSACPAAQ